MFDTTPGATEVMNDYPDEEELDPTVALVEDEAEDDHLEDDLDR